MTVKIFNFPQNFISNGLQDLYTALRIAVQQPQNISQMFLTTSFFYDCIFSGEIVLISQKYFFDEIVANWKIHICCL